MQYFLTDTRGVLIDGPHQIVDPRKPLPARAVVTENAPQEPDEGEVIVHAGGGRWVSAPEPTPLAARLPIVTHYQFATEYLTVDQNDAWLALVEAARDAVADGTASADQKAQLRAYRHFEMAGAVDFNTDATQAACMALYVWGALGPVWDQVSEITSAEQAAIDHAARLSKGEKVAGGG